MIKTAALRTNYLQLVIQNVLQPHNVSACLRSAEAFGIQKIQVVNLKEKFKVSSVARGSGKWLSISKQAEIATCAQELKAGGYKIAAAVIGKNQHDIHSLPIDQPLALVFGNEHEGISPQWLPHIDYSFKIPMVGMVESFNISVAVAISLFSLRSRCSAQIPEHDFLLNPSQQELLLDQWTAAKFS